MQIAQALALLEAKTTWRMELFFGPDAPIWEGNIEVPIVKRRR